MAMYALLLNDMRCPNIEDLDVVRTAAAPQELADWYFEQAAEPWRDGQWNKMFKPGSALEWYNPCADIRLMNDYMGGVWCVPDHTPLGPAARKASRWPVTGSPADEEVGGHAGDWTPEQVRLVAVYGTCRTCGAPRTSVTVERSPGSLHMSMACLNGHGEGDC